MTDNGYIQPLHRGQRAMEMGCFMVYYDSPSSANTRVTDNSTKKFLWWGAPVWVTWGHRMLVV